MRKIFKIGTAIIIESLDGKVLLQHRDDNPYIKYPQTWVLFGGGLEKGETPVAAIKREIMEELRICLDNYEFYKDFYYEDEEEKHHQFIFHTHMDIDTNNVLLLEGDDMKYFCENEIKELKLGFNMKFILNDFFRYRELNCSR